jgi:hypothetical protein
MAREWTKDDVKQRFREAVYILGLLPPAKVQGYFSLMPEYLHSEEEKREQEPEPMRVRPNPAALSRMEEVFEWIHWVRTPYERHLIWWRAERLPWKVIRERTGYCRTTLTEHHNRALEQITVRLNFIEEMAGHERTKKH